MVHNSKKAIYLDILQQEVDKLMQESNSLFEKKHRYEALKNIIDLISQEEEFNIRFDEFSGMIISMAQLDFTKRIDVGDGDDLFSYIATSLNLLNEELEHRAAPVHFLQEVLEMIPEPIVITNDKGLVRFFNSEFTSLTGFTQEELINTSLAELFNSETLEGIMQESTKSSRAEIRTKDGKKMPVAYIWKNLTGANDTASGLLFSLKK